MGAWSEETFGNDTACDWKGDFLDAPGMAKIAEALYAVLNETHYIEGDIACEALAACEVIARLKGNWGVRDAYSQSLDQWIEQNPQNLPPELIARAEAAIARIMSSDSELPELWDEGGRNEAWHRAVEDLTERVKS